MQNLIEIGKRIKQLRKEKRMTLIVFSERIKRNYSTISKIEAGKLELSPLICSAICDTFGINKEWLLTGAEPKYQNNIIYMNVLEEKAKELGKGVYNSFIVMKSAYQLRKDTVVQISHPAFDELFQRLERILTAGDKAKIDAIKGMLKVLDPGEKKE